MLKLSDKEIEMIIRIRASKSSSVSGAWGLVGLLGVICFVVGIVGLLICAFTQSTHMTNYLVGVIALGFVLFIICLVKNSFEENKLYNRLMKLYKETGELPEVNNGEK